MLKNKTIMEKIEMLKAGKLSISAAKRLVFDLKSFLNSEQYNVAQNILETGREEVKIEAYSRDKKKSSDILLGEMNGLDFLEKRTKDYIIITENYIETKRIEKKIDNEDNQLSDIPDEPGGNLGKELF